MSSPIGFIKIDAEGHEPNVLAVARMIPARDRPRIYAEINAWCLPTFSSHSLVAFIRALFHVFDVGILQADG